MNLSAILQPVFILVAVGIGLALGATTNFDVFSVHLIEPFLMVLLFFVFLSVDGKKFKESFRNIGFTLTATAINFLWTPAFAFLLGWLFFPESIDLQMGLVMLLVTPCTDWYLVFTGLANGNVELGASILPLNLLLQILLLPVYLMLFFGGSVEMSSADTILSIVFVLVVPFALSWVAKHIRAAGWENFIATLKDKGDDLQLVFLCLAVVAMFASESRNVFDHPMILLRMLIPMALFFVVNFLLVRVVGRLRKLPYDDMTALNFTTLARNSPLSLAIAVAAFPDHPLISLALVIGPLIELPALGLIAGIIGRGRERSVR